MLQNRFEQVDDSHFEGPMELDHVDLARVGNFVIMEVVHEQVQVAFETFDVIQNEVLNGCNSFDDEDEPTTTYGQPLGDGWNVDDGSNINAFDLTFLKDAIAKFYKGSSSTKLATTILLMNLCTFHEMTKKNCDELFTLLHQHLLPTNNCLLVNYHVVKSLTRKLGLDYQTSMHVQ
jgi:hypothetical protein